MVFIEHTRHFRLICNFKIPSLLPYHCINRINILKPHICLSCMRLSFSLRMHTDISLLCVNRNNYSNRLYMYMSHLSNWQFWFCTGIDLIFTTQNLSLLKDSDPGVLCVSELWLLFEIQACLIYIHTKF